MDWCLCTYIMPYCIALVDYVYFFSPYEKFTEGFSMICYFWTSMLIWGMYQCVY